MNDAAKYLVGEGFRTVFGRFGWRLVFVNSFTIALSYSVYIKFFDGAIIEDWTESSILGAFLGATLFSGSVLIPIWACLLIRRTFVARIFLKEESIGLFGQKEAFDVVVVLMRNCALISFAVHFIFILAVVASSASEPLQGIRSYFFSFGFPPFYNSPTRADKPHAVENVLLSGMIHLLIRANLTVWSVLAAACIRNVFVSVLCCGGAFFALVGVSLGVTRFFMRNNTSWGVTGTSIGILLTHIGLYFLMRVLLKTLWCRPHSP